MTQMTVQITPALQVMAGLMPVPVHPLLSVILPILQAFLVDMPQAIPRRH